MVASESGWASSPQSRARMRANRRRDTSPELAVRRALHARGYRYYVDRRPLKSLNRRADLVFPRLKVAVFVDGCFWHGCPEHHTHARSNAGFWQSKVEVNRARDSDTVHKLTAAGWEVLRIWEHEPVSDAVARIEETLAGQREKLRRGERWTQ